ncbi:DUF1127 domain-containing protein [Rhodobacterales bacterium HKCCE2091]|nr:DUF1127 domain-containing protein [Rhodobacterales bacterium HKCCE2091]
MTYEVNPYRTATLRHGRTGPGLRQLIAAFGRMFASRRQYRHLEELPDYLLDDIGLTRWDIAQARRDESLF